jgi:phage shock protein PspC (stress-responsive transcriptional regulator)
MSGFSKLQVKNPLKISMVSIRNLIEKYGFYGFSGLALLTGTYSRLKAFRDFRSLWGDEACLAVNILDREYPALLQPLGFEQGAPIGYLFVVKTLTGLWGDSENVLRSFALLCSILSIFLFGFLVIKLMNKTAALFSIWLFAIHPGLIRYASEVKQYSTDVLVFIGLAILALWLLASKRTWRDVVVAGIAGFMAILFSHPSVFMLAIIGIVWLMDVIRKGGNISEWVKLGGVGLVWVGTFLSLYYLVYSNLHDNLYLVSYWQNGFPPLPISPREFYWYLEQPLFLFHLSSYNPYWGIAALLFLIGVIGNLIKPSKPFLLLAAPLVLTFLVSIFQLYPFAGRMILFLTPAVIGLAGFGLQILIENQSVRMKYLVVLTTFFLVSAYPILWVIYPQERIFPQEELKPVLRTISREQQEGDFFYVYYGANCSFLYYARQFDISEDRYLIGDQGVQNKSDSNEWEKVFSQDILSLRGKERVWFVFSHYTFLDLEKSVELLELHGTVINSVNYQKGASGYLVDLAP